MVVCLFVCVGFLYSVISASSVHIRLYHLNIWRKLLITLAQQKGHFLRNWKVLEEKKSRDCFSLSEVSSLSNSCKAVFHASVGEIFLPFTQHPLDDSEKEKMFISRRLYKTEDNSLVEDLICTGCQLCGSPLDLEYGYGTLYVMLC